MGVYYQATQPKIEFYHSLDNSTTRLYKIFSATSGQVSGQGLQSYSFSRSTKQLVGNFTLTIKEDTETFNIPFLDNVKPLDIVKIYENDSTTPDFIGIVSNISFGAIASALSKIITISGKSIEYLFDLYKLNLDVTAFSWLNSEALNKEFIDNLYKVQHNKVQKNIEKPITLKTPKTKAEVLDNLTKSFDYKNLEMIKNTYASNLIGAKDALNTLVGKYQKDYVIGILMNAGASAFYLSKAAEYSESKVNELRKQYKEEAQSFTNIPTTTETVTVDEIENKPIKISEMVYLTLEYLQSQMEKNSEIGTADLYKLMKSLYNIQDNKAGGFKITKMNLDCDLEFKYPIASNIFTNTTIKIFDYLKTLLPNNVYEIFGTVKKGKPYIVIREMPFSTLVKKTKETATDENASSDKFDTDDYTVDYQCFLDLFKSDYEFPADLITDYTFSLSNEQVYTAFMSYVEGSELSSEKALIMEATKKGYKTAKVNKEKIAKYGYNLLKTNFIGYNDNTKENYTFINIFNLLNEKLKSWYGNLDELYTGDVTVIKVDDRTYPKIGEVCKVCNAYFYIISESHSWRYGDVLKINYKLDRGGNYTKNSFKKIKGLSKQFSELTRGTE